MATTTLSKQQFFDSAQYSIEGIRKYESIFGDGFISTGGAESSIALLEKFVDSKIKIDGAKILDVGCGVGGGSKLLADRYNAHVLGVDLSTNVLKIAKSRFENDPNLTFVVQDVLSANYEDESFDLIYSRDAILHIKDKEKLYKSFYRWLKPGGLLLITEYGLGSKDTNDHKQYREQRGYYLLNRGDYEKLVRNAGFDDAVCADETHWYREILKKERQSLLDPSPRRSKFLTEFSENELKDLISGWDRKLEWTSEGCHAWLRINAVKPVSRS